VAHLASDALEGRGPATAGIHEAAKYLEKELAAVGLEPAFGDGFLQPFEMVVSTTIGAGSSAVQGKTRLDAASGFRPYAFSSPARAEGAPVLLGFGVRAKEHGYDDYEGANVEGKIVLVLSGEPGEDDPASPFDGKKTTSHSSARKKALLAREAKASALLVVRDALGKLGAHTDEADAGIVAGEITTAAAAKLLGLDPAAVRKAIDRKGSPIRKEPRRAKVVVTADVTRERRTVHNVGGMIPPRGSDEWVVLGAHYDHLGYGGSDSLAVGERAIHNGADDNASGTAVVIEVARSLIGIAGEPRRGLLFLLFAGEEHGLLGSAHFVKNAPIPMAKVAGMVNLDMVGRLRGRRLNVFGVQTATELRAFAEARVRARGLTGSFSGDGYGPSDHTSFYKEGVPVLFLHTGAHTDYHKPSDDPATLNHPGMAEVGALAADMIDELARGPRLTYAKSEPPPSPSGLGRGYGPYFGSIPDFGEHPRGVLLAGVRAGSPAAKAGVMKGDVIVSFNGVATKSLQDMTFALQDCAPGDEIEVVVERNGQPITVRAVLAKRE
jgi:hypothetical protein